MKKSVNFLFIVYIMIFEFLVLYPLHSTKMMLLLMIINVLTVLSNKKIGLFAMMSSFIMSNELIALLNFILITLITGRITKNNTKVKNTIVLLIIIICNSIISAIINNTLVNVFFSVLYLLIILYTIKSMNGYEIEEKELCKYQKKFIIIEFVICLSILMVHRIIKPNDINYGTFMNAHLLGNWLIVSILYLVGNKNKFINIKNNFMYIVMCIVMLYFSDSKALIVSLLILLIMSPLIKLLNRSKKSVIATIFIGIYIFLYLLTPIINNNTIKSFINNHDNDIYKYIYIDQWNYKFKYIEGTLYNELKGYRFFVGFGLGQYGSRFANLFTYDISHRTDNMLNNFVRNNFSPHYNQNYVKYIKFYNDDFVSGIQWRSAILTYPFNSLIAIIGEIGWIGLIFAAIYINKLYKDSKYKNILYFFILTLLFDNYFDMFLSIGIVILFMSLKEKKDNNLIEDERREKYDS